MRLNSAYEIVKVNDACLLVDIESDIYYKIDEELFCIIESVESISNTHTTSGVDFLKSKGILLENENSKDIPKVNRSKNVFSITRIKLLSFRVTKFLTRFINFTHINSFKHWGILYVCIGVLGLLLSALCIVLSVTAIQNEAISVNVKNVMKSAPYVYASLFLISCFHEFGHALMCMLYCRFVGKCGIMLFFLTPAFFTNTTISKFASKKERAQIISAGIVFQCLVSIVLSILLIAGLKWNNFVWTTLYVIFWFNLISTILNVNPLFKYDGYWMLSLMWNIDFLYEKSIVAVKNMMLGKWSKMSSNKMLTVYGIAVMLFYITMWIGSIIGIYYILYPIIGWFCIAIIAVIVAMIIKEILGWRNLKI